jgi:hypothetical protein
VILKGPSKISKNKFGILGDPVLKLGDTKRSLRNSPRIG